MSDVDEAARKAIADVLGPLIEAHGGAQEVATVVGVHKTRVYEWMRGNIPIQRIGALASKLGVDITIHFSAGGGLEITERAAPPEWAKRLLTGAMALEAKGGVTDAELDRAEALAAAWLASGGQLGRRRPGGGGAGGASNA